MRSELDRRKKNAALPWSAVMVLTVMFLPPFCQTAEAEDDGASTWSVALGASVIPMISGDAGEGESAPRYSDAFDTGYGFTLEVERNLTAHAALQAGVGFESHSGKVYEGFAFGDLDIMPVYAGGKYQFGGSTGWQPFLGAHLGGARMSAVDVTFGSLSTRYWDSSWVLLLDAGVGIEYQGGGPWSVSVHAAYRSLGKPGAAFGDPSEAQSVKMIPVELRVNYSF